MILSVIIVSYNVRRHLLQCIDALRLACSGIAGGWEVIIVDNASTDGTAPMDGCVWIQNTDNVGYARANNQGVKIAQGKYILFLNPDTIVTPEAIMGAVSKLDTDAHCGAVGVRMLNAGGAFLPESKRGFPMPFASMSKLMGLYKLFPNSRRLNRYYLSWLSPDEEHEVEVLCGAFMMVRNAIGANIDSPCDAQFDERFFMYGEDIDLSVRIGQTAQCVYLPTPIIHYKGESAKSNTAQSTRAFFQAMRLFHEKYRISGGWWLNIGISCASVLQRRSRKRKQMPTIVGVFSDNSQQLCMPDESNTLRLCFFMALPFRKNVVATHRE